MPEWRGLDAQHVKCENDAELEAAVVAYWEGPEVQRIVSGLLAQAGQAISS